MILGFQLGRNKGEFLTRCVYALAELMYVHTSVPFRGIYMDDNVLHSERYIIYAKIFTKLQIARGKSIL